MLLLKRSYQRWLKRVSLKKAIVPDDNLYKTDKKAKEELIFFGFSFLWKDIKNPRISLELIRLFCFY